MSQRRLARRIRTRRRRSEKLSFVSQQRRHHILEDIALGHYHAAGLVIKGMASVAVEVIVDDVQKRVSA